MKRFRKCDTAKYRRRRKKEKVAHGARVKRRRQEEIERHRIARDTYEKAEALRLEYRKQEQALVNVLAARLYQLSPEHAEAARVREFFRTLKAVSEIFRR